MQIYNEKLCSKEFIAALDTIPRLALSGINKQNSLVEQCDVIRNGMLRLKTPFIYPNGSNIDLFLGEINNVQQGEFFEGFILTDLGQTSAYLLDLNMNIWTNEKHKQIISDICDSLKVTKNESEFKIYIPKEDIVNLQKDIIRLSQACIRFADLSFLQSWTPSVAEQVATDWEILEVRSGGYTDCAACDGNGCDQCMPDIYLAE